MSRQQIAMNLWKNGANEMIAKSNLMEFLHAATKYSQLDDLNRPITFDPYTSYPTQNSNFAPNTQY